MFSFNCKGTLIECKEPVTMGILNVTPDSFFAASRSNSVDGVLSRAESMISEGVFIIDVGGQSTRPGSVQVDADEELKRVLPAIQALQKRFPELLLSIDTFYAKVAKEAIAAGAAIINDVSAGTIDAHLFETVATLQVPYVLTHMQGKPSTMQHAPTYDNVTLEVFDFLNRKSAELVKLGVMDIILDPGFGFGKTTAHNYQLLREMNFFSQLEKPLLIGVSRKGMIYKPLAINAEEALNGTTAVHMMALMNGANILRVHDVKAAQQAIQLFKLYHNKDTTTQ